MKNRELLREWIPEIYLVISVIYYWILTGTFLNPVAVILMLILIIHCIKKNPIAGVIISILFLVINLYMVLALLSELSEFPTFNKKAQTMLLFGSVYLGLNITLSIVMFTKWRKKLLQLQQIEI